MRLTRSCTKALLTRGVALAHLMLKLERRKTSQVLLTDLIKVIKTVNKRELYKTLFHPVLRQLKNWMFTGCIGAVLGLSMGCIGAINGLYWGYQWAVLGLSMGCIGAVNGLSMDICAQKP